MSENDFQAKMLEGMSEMKAQLTRLNTAVLGDEKAGVDGIVDRVRTNEAYIGILKEEKVITKTQDHEKYIQKDKISKAKLAGALVVAFPVISFLWDKIQHFLGWK